MSKLEQYAENCWALREETVDEPKTPAIDYELFCCTFDNTRNDIQKPFIRNGHRYCTDGYIAIRESVDPNEGNTEGRFPESMFPLLDEAESLMRKGIPCPDVEGPPSGADKWWRSEKMETCSTCRGRGMHECDCGHEHECENCEGDGKYLETSAADEARERIEIGEFDYQRQFLWRVSQLPGVRLHPEAGKDGMLPFSFTNGIGVMMNILR